MAFFGGSEKLKQDQVNESRKRLESNISNEYIFVRDGKKTGNIHYMITSIGLQEEKNLIKIIIEYQPFHKFNKTIESIFEICYNGFRQKAHYNTYSQTYGLTENSKKGFLENLNFYRGKPLSVAYMEHMNYWFHLACNGLESNYKGNPEKINTLQLIGADINKMIDDIFPNVEDL